MTFNGLGFTSDTLNANDGQNIFYWVESHSESAYLDWDLTPNTIGMTIYTINAQQELLDVDIIMNGVDHIWSLNGDLTYKDVQAIATHEIGHMIGLGDLTFCPWDPEILPTMCNPYFGIEQRTIEIDDAMGIGFLYNKTINVPGTIPGDFPSLDFALNETVQNSAQTVIAKKDLHEIANDAIVKIGTTLKIREGATLKFGPIRKSGDSESKSSLPGLIVQGKVLISPHRINTTFQPGGGAAEWSGINFESTADNSSSLINATIDKAKNGVYLDAAEPTLKDLTITNSSNSGIYMKNTSPTLDDIHISNCTNGIYMTNSSPIIKNSTINNNSYGLRIYNGYSSPDWNTIHISNNTISDNTYYGLYLYNSSPTLSSNVISSNGRSVLWSGSNPILDDNDFMNSTYYGLACFGNCSPSMYVNGSIGGYNTIIYNGAQGIRITGSSDPILGRLNPSMGGYNSIYSNSGYEIDNTTSNSIMAMHNWWGSAAGPGSDYTGTVDWLPPLSYDPNDPSKANQVNTNFSKTASYDFSLNPHSDLPVNLQKAYYEQSMRNYSAASDSFRNHFINVKGSKYNARSVIQFIKSLSYYQSPGEIVKAVDDVLINDLDVTTRFELLSAKANQCILAQNPGEALFALDEALRDKLTKENTNRNYLQRAMIYAYSLNDKSNAEKYFNILIDNSEKNSDYYLIAEEELSTFNKTFSKSSEGYAQTETVIKPNKYLLLQNYPNPFNPETKIRFNLPEDLQVKLEVYNIQGRKVITLVDKMLPAGIHTATFIGSNYSSGIYFYKIVAGEYSEVKRMLLIK